MRLSPTEKKIAEKLAEGWDVASIAKEFGTQPGTVRQQLARVYCKLDIPWDGRGAQQMKLALFWNCELFRIGLAELKLVA